MSDWKFDHQEVLQDDDGYWWHVSRRYECRDTGEREYYLWDGTHTGDRYVPAEFCESKYESLGWQAAIKPAAVEGFRVNGILSEPANVDRWLGNACNSDYDCPNCGEPTEGAADFVVSFTDGHVEYVEVRCSACGETTEVGQRG